MKGYLFVIIILTFFNASAQFEKIERDKKIYVFKSFEDFKSDNGEYIGDYEDFVSSPLYNKFAFAFKKENGKNRYIMLKKSYWGFKIGKTVFRKSKSGSNVVLGILKEKEKIFYLSGVLVLRMLGNNSDSGWTSGTHAIFYSDTYESKVFHIEKILKNEKENSALLNFNKCIEKGKDLNGEQAKFEAYKDCVQSF